MLPLLPLPLSSLYHPRGTPSLTHLSFLRAPRTFPGPSLCLPAHLRPLNLPVFFFFFSFSYILVRAPGRSRVYPFTLIPLLVRRALSCELPAFTPAHSSTHPQRATLLRPLSSLAASRRGPSLSTRTLGIASVRAHALISSPNRIALLTWPAPLPASDALIGPVGRRPPRSPNHRRVKSLARAIVPRDFRRGPDTFTFHLPSSLPTTI